MPALGACATPRRPELESELAALEKQSGGRLGAFILDTGTGMSFGHRANERFGMCSTFKLPLAAVILRESEAGRIELDRRLTFLPEDAKLLWPDTKAKLTDGGMTIRDMARTTQITSDNGCANALLRQIGGPAGFTARLRALGDDMTRLDRYEPEANLVFGTEVRDTTTPEAIAKLMQRILLGNALNADHEALLTGWTIETKTGLKRIRAGLPPAWQAGDKTGTWAGSNPQMVNKYCDIAITWPPGKAPIIIAAYLDGPGRFEDIRDEDQAILAGVGRVAAKWVQG